MNAHLRRTPCRGRVFAITFAVVALLAAACSNDSANAHGVASVGLPGSGSSSPSDTAPNVPGDDVKLAFSRCMRAHGVKDFPDPGSKGGSGGNLDPSDPTFETAYQACESLLPPGSQTLQQMQYQRAERGLQFARCMRVHGITGFPDPNGDGQFPESRMQTLGKGSQQFSAAQDACQTYLNPPASGGT